MSAGGARRGAAAAVYVVGSINTDLVVYVERLPVGGETMLGSGLPSSPAAARAGVATTGGGEHTAEAVAGADRVNPPRRAARGRGGRGA